MKFHEISIFVGRIYQLSRGPPLDQAQAGYRTGAFGKVAPLASPLEQGFEVFVGQVDQALCHNMYPKKIDSG